MYNFTNFAMTLNELEPGMEGVLAPTDCRLRPDIRAMENGNMGNEVIKTQNQPYSAPCCSHMLNPNIWFLWLCVRVCADEASREKERLEEKQRAARKERAKDGEEWSTRLVLLLFLLFLLLFMQYF